MIHFVFDFNPFGVENLKNSNIQLQKKTLRIA